MPDGLQFVLILPDGSKSLIPADWTDFKTPAGLSQASLLVGSLDDLLRLRGLVDALLRRSADLSVISGTSQEAHAATQSELPRHPRSGDAPRKLGPPPSQIHTLFEFCWVTASSECHGHR